MVINNFIGENKQLQEEIKHRKQCRHCERIDKFNKFQHELKAGHDQFSLLKMICIAVFFV